MTTDTETKNREQELHDRRVAYMRESLERLCSNSLRTLRRYADGAGIHRT